MSQNQVARKILKKHLVPTLKTEGFHGTFPDFQRHEDGNLHLLSVVFDKNGGGFFLEFSRHPSGDFESSWGDVISEKDLTVAHTPFESRARLQQNGHQNSLSEDWFRYEKMSESQIETVVHYVSSLLNQVNDWLRENRVGRNVSATEP